MTVNDYRTCCELDIRVVASELNARVRRGQSLLDLVAGGVDADASCGGFRASLD